MKIWLLALIVGSGEHQIAEYESMEACARAGSTIHKAALEAYGSLSPKLHFRCERIK